MIKKIKNMLIALTAVSTLALPLLAPTLVYAQSTNATAPGLCSGINLDPTVTDCNSSATDAQTHINDLLKEVINIFSVIVGVIAVIMIIFGGLKYITSGGDSGNVSGAKNTIIYALVGLVIVALAQFIVRFVLGKATAAI
jgi:hypothetical protein